MIKIYRVIASFAAVATLGVGAAGIVGAGAAYAHNGTITGHEKYDSMAECYSDLDAHQEHKYWGCSPMSDGRAELTPKTSY
ncbi:hypothetical protein [Nocardia sp. NPDC051463]|uniref:hypothetical protein n=1 Tax=Nocardia sp. NPDC051463 TaxID=3154845 RepID=UPI00344CD51B